MRVETRSSLILLATLALGILLGVVSGGRWRQMRTESVQDMRRPAGFVNHLLDIIQPRAEQRDEVRRVLDSTARRNTEILQGAQDSLRSALEAMRERLAPVLDEAQRARLADESNFGAPLGPPPRAGPPPENARRPPPRAIGPRGERPPRAGPAGDRPPPPPPDPIVP